MGNNNGRLYPLRYDYFTLAYACGVWRHEQGIRQSRIAEDLDLTSTAVSNFERGKNNNAAVFLWYIKHGFIVEWYERFLNGKGDELTYYGEKRLR